MGTGRQDEEDLMCTACTVLYCMVSNGTLPRLGHDQTPESHRALTVGSHSVCRKRKGKRKTKEKAWHGMAWVVVVVVAVAVAVAVALRTNGF